MSKLRDTSIQVGAINIKDDYEMANALDTMLRPENRARRQAQAKINKANGTTPMQKAMSHIKPFKQSEEV
jgi:hypothetical protein